MNPDLEKVPVMTMAELSSLNDTWSRARGEDLAVTERASKRPPQSMLVTEKTRRWAYEHVAEFLDDQLVAGRAGIHGHLDLPDDAEPDYGAMRAALAEVRNVLWLRGQEIAESRVRDNHFVASTTPAGMKREGKEAKRYAAKKAAKQRSG